MFYISTFTFYTIQTIFVLKKKQKKVLNLSDFAIAIALFIVYKKKQLPETKVSPEGYLVVLFENLFRKSTCFI